MYNGLEKDINLIDCLKMDLLLQLQLQLGRAQQNQTEN